MKIKRFAAKSTIIGIIALAMVPLLAQGAQITSRSVTLVSSAAGATTDHIINFTTTTAGNVGSIRFDYCTTALGTCNAPAGLTTTGATLGLEVGATGFSMVNGSNGSPYLTRTSTNIPASTAVSYTLSNIVNPSAVNTTFYVRISTYVSTNTTGGSTDDGVVAVSTTQALTISGTMPESLTFCVGTSGTDCTNMTGTALNLGVFSPSSTNSGTTVMSAGTNASFGYAITASAAAFSSGANTIAAMGDQSANSTGCTNSCTTTVGTGQFGINLRANTTPSVGTNVFGLGSGGAYGGYNTSNVYRFFSGDVVASAAGPTKSNLYTTSYIVNVSPDQAAGVYTTTMTYTCTATF